MHIEHKTEKGTLCFVKLPNSSTGSFSLVNYKKHSSLKLEYLVGGKNVRIESIKFESENLQLIGLTSEVTEQQAKMMVDSEHPVYGTNGEFTTQWATDSFKYLMQHLQVYEFNPYENGDLYLENGYSDSTWDKWQEAESRTGKWIVLFKPND